MSYPERARRGPRASRPESGLSYNQSESSAGITRSTARHAVSPPGLIEMVKRDLAHQWEQGHQVSVETYLAAMPALGTLGDCLARPDHGRIPGAGPIRCDARSLPV